jgi:hypothetical protein
MKSINYAMSAFIAAGLVLMLLAPRTPGETPTPQESLDLQQVALFKNGVGFFVGQVTCPAGKASFQIALPTAPSHGTFWVSYPPSVTLTHVIAKQIESEQTVEAVSIPEILKANPNRKVRVVIGDKEVSGVIKYVAQDRDAPRPDPYLPGGRGDVVREYQPRMPYPAGLLVIEADAGELALDLRAISQVIFLDGQADRRLALPGKSAVLEVRLKSPAPAQKLIVSYLGKGVTWAPSYMIDIADGDKARLSAKALIINDACQFKGAAVHLVTGFPHLQFVDIVSPIALKTDLAQFLQALSKGESERGRTDVRFNVMAQSASYSRMQGEAAMPAYGAAEAGQVAEDLFLYPAGPINLEKGEVAYVPLFTETVPYRHVYQWDIPDYVNEEGSYQSRREPPDDTQEQQQVWHGVRLTNTTKVPWTTAPGQIVREAVILGQDTLGYTPSGGESTLRITQAVGVKAEQRELETDRRREAAHLYGYSYDLVTVRGELSVANFQDKAIALEITKTLSGELKSAEPNAKPEKLAAGLRRMNGLLKLTWTLDLPAGEQKNVTYTYEVYIRR